MYRYMCMKKVRCLLFIVLLVVSGVTGTLFALVMSALVDCAGKSPRELLAVLLGSIAYVVVCVLLDASCRCVKAAVLADARYHLKNDIFAGIMGKNGVDFDRENSAEYINELSNNMDLFESVYFGNIICVLECLTSFGAASAVCIALQPLMLVLMLFLALLTMWVTRLTTAPLEKSTEKFAQSAGEYMAEIKDDFGGFRLVHSYGILASILEKHAKKNGGMETAKRKNTNCQILCSYTGQFIGLLSTVLVMAMASWFSIRGMFSAGMVIAFGHLIGNIVSPITLVPAIIANFRAAKPLQERFGKLLGQKREDGSQTLPALREALTVEKLSFGYQKEKEVLHQFSYRFQAGGHYAVVGSSGSGKSTLLALLVGYYRDYSGKIWYDQVELGQLKGSCVGELAGVVSQDTFLFNDTIQNNITLFGEGYTQQEIEQAVEEAGLKELVASLPEGNSTMISENGRNFSGGERQRFSLARVLLRKNRILLLDEFTANLDEQTAREIEKRMLDRRDCLIITVTHRLNPEILRRYDQILVLSQGKLAESGTYDELMEAGGALKRLKMKISSEI